MTRIGPLVLALVILAPISAPAGELDIEVVNADGRPVWARVEVRAADGKMYRPADGLRDRTATTRTVGEPWYLGSYVARGRSRVEAPAGEYLVVVERGPEYERFEERVTLGDDGTVRVLAAPRRWIELNELGWYSADFDVRRSVEDLEALVQAEDVNLAAAVTIGNRRDDWGARPLPKNPVRTVDPSRVFTLANAEDNRAGGTLRFHMLREKIAPPEPHRRFPLGVELIERVLAQRYVETSFPWVDAGNPLGWETPVVMALAPPDSIGLLHDRFLEYGVESDEAPGRPRNPERYPGERGFAEYNFELLYRYWNLGFRIPASAGSGSGAAPNPVGGNRVYVQIPNEPFGVEPFYRNLRQGRSFVTNGPVLFFDAIARPGREVEVRVDVRSRDPIDRVEIVANGVVIETFGAPPGKRSFAAELNLRGGLYSWVAARAYTQHDAAIRVAHTSPVWLAGAWSGSDDAAYFIAWIDELIAQTEADPERFRSEREREAALAIYRQAREVYEAKR